MVRRNKKKKASSAAGGEAGKGRDVLAPGDPRNVALLETLRITCKDCHGQCGLIVRDCLLKEDISTSMKLTNLGQVRHKIKTGNFESCLQCSHSEDDSVLMLRVCMEIITVAANVRLRSAVKGVIEEIVKVREREVVDEVLVEKVQNLVRSSEEIKWEKDEIWGVKNLLDEKQVFHAIKSKIPMVELFGFIRRMQEYCIGVLKPSISGNSGSVAFLQENVLEAEVAYIVLRDLLGTDKATFLEAVSAELLNDMLEQTVICWLALPDQKINGSLKTLVLVSGFVFGTFSCFQRSPEEQALLLKEVVERKSLQILKNAFTFDNVSTFGDVGMASAAHGVLRHEKLQNLIIFDERFTGISVQLVREMLRVCKKYQNDFYLQGFPLTTLESWVKHLSRSFEIGELAALPFWKRSGRQLVVETMDFVIDHWEQRAPKTRFLLSRVLQSSIDLLDYVGKLCTEEADEAEMSILRGIESNLILRLVVRVKSSVNSTKDELTGNLKIILPIFQKMIEKRGVGVVLDKESGFVPLMLDLLRSQPNLEGQITGMLSSIAKDCEMNQRARSIWLDPIIDVLTGDDNTWMKAICNVCLPSLFDLLQGSFTCENLLEILKERGATLRAQFRVLIAFCETGKRLDFAIEGPAPGQADETILHVSFGFMMSALEHLDPFVRLDAAKMVLAPPRRPKMVSASTIKLAKVAYSHLTKEFEPSVSKEMINYNQAFMTWLRSHRNSDEAHETVWELIEWFKREMLDQLYPTVPRDRSSTVLGLLDGFVSTFRAQYDFLQFSCKQVLTLLCMLQDENEMSRRLSDSILNTIPGCLPGYEDWDLVGSVVDWAKILLKSSRLREKEAGAAILKLIFSKYVIECGWALTLSPRIGIPDSMRTKVDNARMHLACRQAFQCDSTPKAYNVGCVIVSANDRQIIAHGFSRELPGNTHAEETALMKLGGFTEMEPNEEDVARGCAKGCTLYTTMEPCSKRLSGNRSCTSRCIAADVTRIVVGVREPSKFVICEGTRVLREKGVVVDYLDDEFLKYRCMEPNMFLFPGEEKCHFEETNEDDFDSWALAQHLEPGAVAESFFISLLDELEKAWSSKAIESTGLVKAVHECWKVARTFFEKDCMTWRRVGSRTLNLLQSLLDEAAAVIGSSGSDVLGSEVDCRGHRIVAYEDGSSPEDNGNVDVVTLESWQLVRQTCATIEMMVEVSPLQSESDLYVLSKSQVEAIGLQQLKLLFHLKHQGAIAFAMNTLQGVCSRILLFGRKTNLTPLPRDWLDDLLQKLVDGEHRLSVRRSIGFASAFLAITSAEPRDRHAVLLQKTIEALMHETRANLDVGIRVHSLNILSLLFGSSSLNRELSPYIGEMLVLSIEGFQSPLWQIRNSSMMIFTRMLRIVFGNDNTGEDRLYGGRMNVGVFILKYAFVLESARKILTEIIKSSTSTADSRLYPMLLVLSKLEPAVLIQPRKDGDSAEQPKIAENLNLFPFLPLLVECASQTDAMARSMAARALARLIPSESLAETLQVVFDGAVQALESLNHNRLHGMLLHLGRLCETVKIRRLEASVSKLFQELIQPGLISLSRKVFKTLSHNSMLTNAMWDALLKFAAVCCQIDEFVVRDLLPLQFHQGRPFSEKVVEAACKFAPQRFLPDFLESNDCRIRLVAFENSRLSAFEGMGEALVQITLDKDLLFYAPELRSRLRAMRSCLHGELGYGEVLFQNLCELYESELTGHLVRGALLKTLGVVLKTQKIGGEHWRVFAALCCTSAQYCRTIEERTAALDALRVSEVINFSSDESFEAFEALYLLMQDEVDELRMDALQYVNDILHGSNEPARCERKLLEEFSGKISALFESSPRWREFFERVCEFDLKEFAKEIGTTRAEDLGLLEEKHFSADKENIYVEPTVLAQLLTRPYTLTESTPGMRDLVDALGHLNSETKWPGGFWSSSKFHRSLSIMHTLADHRLRIQLDNLRSAKISGMHGNRRDDS